MVFNQNSAYLSFLSSKSPRQSSTNSSSMAPSQEKYYSAEFGKLPVHFNITQPCPVTQSQTIRNQQSKKRRRPQLSEALDPMRKGCKGLDYAHY
jgi:hypothetical protein